jgi:cysteine-rich repeat protein
VCGGVEFCGNCPLDCGACDGSCGDGVCDPDESCDTCDHDCGLCGECGDGALTQVVATRTYASPIVTNPFGATGHVCSDGGTCAGGGCSLATSGSAPEHGICQALGHDFAVSVDWGGGIGNEDAVMPHAYNWRCAGFNCTGAVDYRDDNCTSDQMLATIVCANGSFEACDDGSANGTGADSCRLDCTAARCGDGVVDTGEECDDGNRVDADACNNRCRFPGCGDGYCFASESCVTCPRDCGRCVVCGDRACDGFERQTCSADCGTCSDVCGDGTCGPTEDCAICARDCGACESR